MQASNLKASLIIACCFVIALCSEIKSMDTASNLQETTFYKVKNINREDCLDSLKTEVISNSPSTLLLLNQDESKDPETSWASYMASPIKAVIQVAYKIGDFTMKHPTQAIITSLLVAAQFTAVAADCNCILSTGAPRSGLTLYTFGEFPNNTTCESLALDPDTIYDYYGCF